METNAKGIENIKKAFSSVGYLRFSKWALLIGYILFVVAPCIYRANITVPKINDLNHASGIVGFKKFGQIAYRLELREGDRIDYFICDTNYGRISCPYENKDLYGKKADVFWFYQAEFPYVKKKRIAILNVGDNEIIGYQSTVDAIGIKNSWFDYLVIILSIPVITYLILLTHVLQKEKEKI